MWKKKGGCEVSLFCYNTSHHIYVLNSLILTAMDKFLQNICPFNLAYHICCSLRQRCIAICLF